MAKRNLLKDYNGSRMIKVRDVVLAQTKYKARPALVTKIDRTGFTVAPMTSKWHGFNAAYQINDRKMAGIDLNSFITCNIEIKVGHNDIKKKYGSLSSRDWDGYKKTAGDSLQGIYRCYGEDRQEYILNGGRLF